MKAWALLLFCLTLPFCPAWAQDGDSGISSIHKIDIQDTPDPSADANYIALDFDVKRLKVPGSRANVVLRQLTKRVRVEFEGDGIPHGSYRLAIANGCPSGHKLSEARYKSSWTELHHFSVTTVTTQTEKSAPNASLRQGGTLVLYGKHLGLFKADKGALDVIDCREIK